MGLFDSVLGAISGNQGQSAQASDPKAMLIQAALRMLTSQSATGATGATGIEGGLSGLLGKLQAAGLGDAVSSWIGNGQNQAISPAQVQQALGGGHLEQLAQATGLSESETASHLSEILPGLIDKLTPNGQIPDAGGGLAGIESMLGGFLGGNKTT
ncbi:YidB family protein [Glaciimonas immobilis]|uniref:Uncharacterized protein YidB (DUF937 family) n=1 Tax=Glaciimonas immobilis TaxID=728004 RepID=A0A840RVY0_9BURK|nr:YidB family protein [Glaciimonas immobilis]KAF3998466.1 DUF937 domain-containing protein [Glaciimonas immobilis]MBB5202035.1 uncharacterized protein YidB (DUF937 family) [Glaciimonas immobilis]